MSSVARLVLVVLLIGLLPQIGSRPRAVAAAAVDHLVISEVVTGGSSASDELIEIYNPTPAALPLEGLELVYVTASGATITRRASWEAGAPSLGPGRHLLVAHELGIYAAIADATYAAGMAATGGSVALRIQGAVTAIDAVGWGTAASTWLEGTPVAAPPAGSSVERRPGGALGSTVDTDDNAADFVARALPDPQNLASPPVPEPGSTPVPSPSPDPTTTPSATAPPPSSHPATPSPTQAALPISVARSLPDGSSVLVEGDALTDSAFTEGGGYVWDGTAGIAVITDGAAFARGERVRLSGTLDTRYAQRTLRVAAGGLTAIGAGAEPVAPHVPTGDVGEDDEALPVLIEGRITGAATQLSGGAAWDVDDGSGAIRVLIGTQTGIDTSVWQRDATVRVVGVVGQRDSSGTGGTGYRVQPRDPGDVSVTAPPTTPTPSATATAGGSPTPAPTAGPGTVTVAEARAAPKNARVAVMGVVTLPSGVIGAESAVIQDSTGAILLRLGDEVGALRLGELVEVAGTRSTKSGMESLRVTAEPRRAGSADGPVPVAVRTADAGEPLEARLVLVRGAVRAAPRSSSSGSAWFEVDDGSGPLRVHLGAGAEVGLDDLTAGSWVEVVGVLGQETTGAQPLRGYRLWPRTASDLSVTAAAAGTAAAGDGAAGGSRDGGGGPAGDSLDAIGQEDLAALRVGATLVAGPWPELGLGGLLWDGERLVGIADASASLVASAVGSRPAPLALELEGLRRAGRLAPLRIELVALGDGPGQVLLGGGPTAAPLGRLPAHGEPAWVSLVGTLRRSARGAELVGAEGVVALERRCATPERGGPPPGASVAVTGIGRSDPDSIVIGCAAPVRAPALALAARTADGPARAIVARSLVAATDDAREAALWPAALFALGAIGLALAALAGHRMARTGASAAGPGRPDDDAEHEEPSTLTLVPRSREHES